MGINLGQTPMKAVYLGQTAVKSVFFGSNQVWGGEEPVPTAEPLCFTAEEANSTVALSAVGSAPVVSLECSTDGSTWSPFVVGTTTVTLANVGDKVYVRATSAGNTGMGTSTSNYNMFVMTGKIAASGNVDTLLDQNGNATLTSYCYIHMFDGCASLTTAPELPATTLAERCYQHMFYNCSSLMTAPSLPATTLADYCYFRMFQNCTSLTTAPAILPAMTLANGCYNSMFDGCTFLMTAPELPATTLANSCYQSMFQDCISLAAAPELPATTLQWGCYNNMFRNCSSLSSVEVAFTEWTSGATNFWLDNVAASGTFTCPAELPDERGSNYIPTGWTVVKPVVATWLCFTAEEANSTVKLNTNYSRTVSLETSTDGTTWTDYSWSSNVGDTLTLANVGDKVYMRAKNENSTITASSTFRLYFVMTGKIAASGNIQTLLKADGSRTDVPAYCYYRLFYNCTSLTKAPELPATTLASNCYTGMFNKCTSLTTAPALPAITIAESCYNNMFENCSSLTSAPELPATTLANSCYYQMFHNCTSLTTAPTLPATTLVEGCYGYMFQGCTSLTTAPTLPATTLANQCYSVMFYGCTQLSSVEVAFTEWTSGATGSWLYNVAASGTFTCPSSLPDTRDESHIPEGWTKVDAA